MANNIALIQKYLGDIANAGYSASSRTAILDGQYRSLGIGYEGTNKILMPKLTTSGLKDYSRATGYAAGDVTLEWVPYELTVDRGIKFTVDAMDVDEAQVSMASIISKFEADKVVPEIDAYRFSKFAQSAGTKATATISKTNAITEVDKAIEVFRDNGVTADNTVLFVSPKTYTFMKQATDTGRWTQGQVINRNIELFDGMQVVIVPGPRFYSSIDLNGTAGGFAPTTTTGKLINFMAVDKGAVFQVAKHVVAKIVDPIANQTSDGWLGFFRVYHDAFVISGKELGVYVNTPSAS